MLIRVVVTAITVVVTIAILSTAYWISPRLSDAVVGFFIGAGLVDMRYRKRNLLPTEPQEPSQ